MQAGQGFAAGLLLHVALPDDFFLKLFVPFPSLREVRDLGGPFQVGLELLHALEAGLIERVAETGGQLAPLGQLDVDYALIVAHQGLFQTTVEGLAVGAVEEPLLDGLLKALAVGVRNGLVLAHYSWDDVI